MTSVRFPQPDNPKSKNLSMQHLQPQRAEPMSVDSGEGQMISSMRSILAVAALVITHIDPTEPSRFAAATYLILYLYVLYSLSLHLITLRGRRFPVLLQYSLHWIDVIFYVSLRVAVPSRATHPSCAK
jgi:hypothetical protein